jgi:hypothetical protein
MMLNPQAERRTDLGIVVVTIGTLLGLLGLIITSFSPGCATQDVPGRTLATAAVTVDKAMQAWAIYVVQGHATASDEAAVRKAYSRYQLSMALAESLYREAQQDGPALDKAIAALIAAKADLINLVTALESSP